MQQRSEEWFKVRRGRFTASEICSLMGKQGLGKTGEEYIFKKAVELLYGVDPEESFTSWDMNRGINLEPMAFNKFQELKAFEFVDVTKASFFPFGQDAGASPDGIVGNDACLEIKCPRSTKFFGLVAKGAEAIDPAYLWQMQFQMLCTNSQRCHFFNYIVFNSKEMWHEIVVERDDNMINQILPRLEQAIKLRNEFVQYLIENQQFETIKF